MSAKDISDHNSDPGAHRKDHKFYKCGTLDMSYFALKSQSYKVYDKNLLLFADSHGTSLTGENGSTIPYNGSFNLSGRIEFDGWATTRADNKSWTFKIKRTRGGSETQIGEFAFTHNSSSTEIHTPPLTWALNKITLEYGDKIHYEFKCINDSDFQTRQPDLSFTPYRTYFVIEDNETSTGTRLAETSRRTLGALNTRGNVGVNAHPTTGAAQTPRVYGINIATNVKSMNKV